MMSLSIYIFFYFLSFFARNSWYIFPNVYVYFKFSSIGVWLEIRPDQNICDMQINIYFLVLAVVSDNGVLLIYIMKSSFQTCI